MVQQKGGFTTIYLVFVMKNNNGKMYHLIHRDFHNTSKYMFGQRNGSKVMYFNNIDYRLLDSLFIIEVNKVRDFMAYYTFIYYNCYS